MPELVGNDYLCPLVLRKPVGVAADPVVHADLHGAGRQELLKARLADLPCGEPVTGYQRRSFCICYRKVGIFRRFAIQDA